MPRTVTQRLRGQVVHVAQAGRGSQVPSPHSASPTLKKFVPPVSEMWPPGPVFGFLLITLAHAVPAWVGAFGFGFGSAHPLADSPSVTIENSPTLTKTFFTMMVSRCDIPFPCESFARSANAPAKTPSNGKQHRLPVLER